VQGEEFHSERAETVHFEMLAESEVGHFDSFHFAEERQLSAGRDDGWLIAQ